MDRLILALVVALVGGETYARELSEAFERAEIVTEVPADLLLSIALVETQGTLRRDRHGKLGRGLMGLNPRSPQFAYATSICDLHILRCLETQVMIAATYLEYERRRCGSWRGALSSYATGRCSGGKPAERYAKMVKNKRKGIEKCRHLMESKAQKASATHSRCARGSNMI